MAKEKKSAVADPKPETPAVEPARLSAAAEVVKLKERVDELEGDLHDIGMIIAKQFGGPFEVKVTEILLRKQGRRA